MCSSIPRSLDVKVAWTLPVDRTDGRRRSDRWRGEDAAREGFPAVGETAERHAASPKLVQNDLGAQLCQERLGRVLGVEVRSGVPEQSDDVRSVGAVRAGVKSLSG